MGNGAKVAAFLAFVIVVIILVLVSLDVARESSRPAPLIASHVAVQKQMALVKGIDITAQQADPTPADTENWMRDMLPLIGDQPLNKIVMPGSHDAASSQISADSGWCDARGAGALKTIAMMFPGITSNFARTHHATLLDQAKRGSRVFDLRPCDFAGKWYNSHGLLGEEFIPSLEPLANFMRTHPQEIFVLIIEVKNVGTDYVQPRVDLLKELIGDLENADINGIIGDIVHLREDRLDDGELQLPIASITPNEMVSAGRNVIVSWRPDVAVPALQYPIQVREGPPYISDIEEAMRFNYEALSKPTEGFRLSGVMVSSTNVHIALNLRDSVRGMSRKTNVNMVLTEGYELESRGANFVMVDFIEDAGVSETIIGMNRTRFTT